MNGYPRTFHFQVNTTGTTPVVLFVPCADLGFVNRLVVVQSAGTLSGFSVDIYDREEAAKGIAEINYGDQERLLLDKEAHQVIPTQTAASGARSLSLFQGSYAFQNVDERMTLQGGSFRTGLWLVLTPATLGNATFDVSLTVVYPTKR